MQWANWISLDIIVTLLACMAQRLASSMRPVTYASAASCRHMMVLPWKHKSYLPTSRAISWANCKKGSCLMRSSVLFWNCWISGRATVPRLVVPGLLNFTSWEEFLLGGFASHSWSELPPGWLLPTRCRWPGLCSHLGQLLGWQQWQWPAHILQPSCLLHPLLCLLHLLLHLSSGQGLLCWGWVVHGRRRPPSFLCQGLLMSLDLRTHLSLPFSPFLGGQFCFCHAGRQKGAINQWEDSMTSFLLRFA